MITKLILNNLRDIQERLAERALRRGQMRNHYQIQDVTFASHYCEPGYDDPKSGVIAFGNWNSECSNRETEKHKRDVMRQFVKILERAKVELEWSDEWTTCAKCYGALRTSGDCWGWQPNYWRDPCDGECICRECVLKNPKDYLDWLENDPRRAITFDLDLKEHGYHELASDFEHGFHHGQDSDPKKVADELRECGVTRFIFKIDDVGQFDMRFSVHVHEDDLEKAREADMSPAATDGPSVSEGLQRALQDAVKKMGELRGEGIKVAKCDASTGTATAKLVSGENFVKGKALD